MQRKRRNVANELYWLLLLIIVVGLFVALLISPELRYRIGGKWVLPGVGLAVAAVIYLQPQVQTFVRRWIADQRDEAEKRWWAEREMRESRAHARTEAMRRGQIERQKRKK